MAFWLVDTNLLLRTVQPESSTCQEARKALDRLVDSGDEACLVPQVIAEFWSVATRPSEVNGLGWTVDETSQEVSEMMGRFVVLPDKPAAFPLWLDLVRKHEIKGKKTHDARLVAVMQAHGVQNLLTFNTGDFAAFDEIKAIHPRDVT